MRNKMFLLLGGVLILGIVFSTFKGKANDKPVISQPSPTIKQEATVPLPQETDIIHIFFNLIAERKITQAVAMMSDDTWGGQLAAMKSVKVLDIAPSMPEEWKDNEHVYKVTLDLIMDPASANQPIPYYGFENGSNIRWVALKKSGNLWKVMGLATGP
jgi:hypothetical protein